MKELAEYQSVRNALESIAYSTQMNILSSLKYYLIFANSEEGHEQEISPDDLILEARKDVNLAQARMEKHLLWLQGKPVSGYSPRAEKGLRESSAFQRVFGCIRSFYAYNNIALDKKWTRKIPKPKETRTAIKKDSLYEFYKVNDETKTIVFDRDLIQRFLSNLKLRDQAITLCLFSSAMDSGELLKLNLGDIRQQQERKRIFLESNRSKTSIPYRTFLSVEATTYLRRYLQQQRSQADDKDPLFVIAKNHGQSVRMRQFHLSSIYRDAARKIGVKWKEKEEWNPLRPKRLRHLFRTACDSVGATELYVNAFMGHSNSIGQDYSELSSAKLELEYLKVEPFLTVYGQSQEISKLEERFQKLQADLGSYVFENKALKERLTQIEDRDKMIEVEISEVKKRIQQLFHDPS